MLAAITTRRAAKLHASNGGARKMGGGGDSLVVHLRLGDVLGQTHFYGVREYTGLHEELLLTLLLLKFTCFWQCMRAHKSVRASSRGP